MALSTRYFWFKMNSNGILEEAVPVEGYDYWVSINYDYGYKTKEEAYIDLDNYYNRLKKEKSDKIYENMYLIEIVEYKE